MSFPYPILLLLLFSLNAHAGNQCGIQQVQAEVLSGRGRSITFPDGREIIVIGHNHGDRALPGEFSKLVLAPTDELSNLEFLNGIKKISIKAAKAREHATEELKFLNQLDRNKIQFLGVEADDAIAQNNLIGFGGLDHRFKLVLEKRAIELDLDDVLLSLISAPFFMKIRNAEKINGIEFIGFESKSATEAHGAALRSAEARMDTLRKIAKNNLRFLSGIGGTKLQIDVLYPTYNPKDHQMYLNSLKLDKIPLEFQDSTVEWVDAMFTEFDARKWRDREIVENILKRNENGILFIGMGHRDSLLEMFRSACLELSVF